MEQTTSNNTKKIILESAKNSFSSFGYEDSRTKDIAKNAGVSEALLFKYFKSKEMLYSAVQKYQIQQLEGNILKIYEDIKSPIEILMVLGKGLLEPDENTPDIICKVGDILRVNQFKFIMTNEHIEEFIDEVLVKLIIEGQKKGEICDKNPKDMAVVYWRFILGSFMSKHYFNSETTDSYMRVILNIFK